MKQTKLEAINRRDNYKDYTEDIELKFKNLIDIYGVILEGKNLKKNIDALFKDLMADGTYTYQDCVIFENRGYAMSNLSNNYNSDQYINTMMQHEGLVGQQVGLDMH